MYISYLIVLILTEAHFNEFTQTADSM